MELFEEGEEDSAHLELDGYLRDMSSAMMEVDIYTEIIRQYAMRGELDCRQTVGERNFYLAPYVVA